MITYLVALAHGNPFAFFFLVGTLLIFCMALFTPEDHSTSSAAKYLRNVHKKFKGE